MTSSHEQKRTLFFCPSASLVLGYYPFISLEDHGCKISGLLTPSTHFLIFFNLGLKRENLKKKWERGFLDEQKQANMAIFVSRPQVSRTISQGSMIFFHTADISVMCISLLTNSVGLKSLELQMFQHWWFYVHHSSKHKVVRPLLINYMPVSII